MKTFVTSILVAVGVIGVGLWLISLGNSDNWSWGTYFRHSGELVSGVLVLASSVFVVGAAAISVHGARAADDRKKVEFEESKRLQAAYVARDLAARAQHILLTVERFEECQPKLTVSDQATAEQTELSNKLWNEAQHDLNGHCHRLVRSIERFRKLTDEGLSRPLEMVAETFYTLEQLAQFGKSFSADGKPSVADFALRIANRFARYGPTKEYSAAIDLLNIIDASAGKVECASVAQGRAKFLAATYS